MGEMRKYRARMLGNDTDLSDMRNRVKVAKMRARALRSNKSLADLEAETGSGSEVDLSEELVDRSTMKESVESLTIKRKRKARRNAAPDEKSVTPGRKGGRRSRNNRTDRKSKNNAYFSHECLCDQLMMGLLNMMTDRSDCNA